nr:N-acetylmuramoyl-L-alanine amidase [uncultured Bacillus sp.]
MFKLYLDPGHGGSDPGAFGNGLQEKDVTLSISLAIRDILVNEYNHVAVHMSRTGDTYPSLSQRTKEANNWGADYYLSIHINSGGGTGFESYVDTGVHSDTIHFQNTIHEEIAKVIEMKDRGKKQAQFHVLHASRMPAILTENGFIDNVADAAKMKDVAWIETVARAHVAGLEKAFNLEKKVTAVCQDLSGKEEDIMSQKFEPSNQAIRNAVSTVLMRFEKKDPSLASFWREKANKGELTISDAVGLLYVAIERGYITGK